jgi:hypothetical protein
MIAQAVELRARWQLKQAHLRVRMPLAELAHRWSDEIIEKRREKAEPQRAACLAKLLAQLLRARFGIADDLPGLRQEKPARIGEVDAFADAIKQRHAQLRLQHGDLTAQRRLRDVQALRRARNAQILGGGDEVTKLVKFHAAMRTQPKLRTFAPLQRQVGRLASVEGRRHVLPAVSSLHGSPGLSHGLDDGAGVSRLQRWRACLDRAVRRVTHAREAGEIDGAVLPLRRLLAHRHVGHEAGGAAGVSR